MILREAKPGQLVRWNVKKSTTFVRVIEPTVPVAVGGRIGTIFGVISAQTDGRTGDALVARIEDAIVRGLEEADRKLPVSVSADQLFEYALSKVNQAMDRLFGEGGLQVDPTSVRSCLVARNGESLSAAVWGKPTMLLVRSEAAAPTDVLAETRTEKERVAYRTPSGFGSMIAGSLGSGDRIVLSTEDLRGLVGEDRLAAVVAANLPEAAAVVIRDALAPLADNLAIAVMVFGSEDVVSAVAEPRNAVPSATLPSPQPAVRAPQTEHAVQPDRPTSIEGTPKNASVSPPRRPSRLAAGFRMFSALADAERRDALIARAKDAAVSTPRALVEKFNALSGKRKLLLLAICVFAITLNGSVVVLGFRKAAEAKTAVYEHAVADVEHLIVNADASLIYRDEARARAMLDEATTRIAALPITTAAQKQRRDELTRKTDEKRAAARREVALPAPVTVLAGHGADALLYKDGAMWIMGDIGVSKIVVDGALQNLSPAPAGTRLILAQTAEGVLAVGSDGAVLIPAKGAPRTETINWKKEEVSANDAAIWGSGLYMLDVPHNRIIKFQADTTGFSSPKPYLKDGTDLSTAASIAIDGSVYVLSRNGRVDKLTRGAAEPFSLSPVEPAVTAATRIRTSGDSDALYVLEPSQGRVLDFAKKDGRFLAQYANASLKDARDIAVDPKTKTLYAATTNSVLKFTLPQQ